MSWKTLTAALAVSLFMWATLVGIAHLIVLTY